MGIRNSYENGTFCWVDLATTNPGAAKQFYARLFGWSFQDFPVENSSPYTMAFKNERGVTGLFLLSSEMISNNIPSHWDSYINVRDLTSTLEAWQSHGGTLLVAPFDVMDQGHMATVQDPTGGTVSLWQANKFIGASVVNETNTFCWAELQTRVSERAIQFYQAIFGWESETEQVPPFYTTCKVKGHPNCGIFDMAKANLPPEIPSHWMVYFNIENLDEAIGVVNSFGGKVLTETMSIEPGRFVTIADPQGAILTLIELNTVDD